MVADRFMYNAGEFPEYDRYYKELDENLAVDLVEVEKQRMHLERHLQRNIAMTVSIIL